MSEELSLGLVSMLMMSSVFRSRAEIKRREADPEYAKQAAARELLKAEEKYNAAYEQANADNDEYERSPRAFTRRLLKSNEYRETEKRE